MSKLIPLSKGLHAIVDNDDYEWLNQWKWCVNGRGYVTRTTPDRKFILIHRIIMNASNGIQVDHINGNKLDNRHENLRFATQAQNNSNVGKHRGLSRFKGVYPQPSGNFVAKITVRGKVHHLGTFRNEAEAARAYDEQALLHFGEYARLNF